MVVWSSLLTKASNPIKNLVKTPLRNNVLTKIPSRTSGHGPETMWIRPSGYSWEVFKDFFHFYIMVGAIPLGCLIFYCNVFIGPAKLAQIPEGYIPQEWEYHRHPITRFMSKWRPSRQEKYERKCHFMHESVERWKLQLLEKKVRRLMQQNLDYQGWYFQPNSVAKFHRREQKDKHEHFIHGSRSGGQTNY